MTQPLNSLQKKAVTSEGQHVLVLAGAGTGKTTVLTHRAAHLINQTPPGRYMLVVTFTNRAAQELKERLHHLLGFDSKPLRKLHIGTFHSIARRHLLHHGRAIGIDPGFTIIDTDDQKRLVKGLMREHYPYESDWTPAQCVNWINRQKNQMIRAGDSVASEQEEEWLHLYHLYEAHCKREQLLDFEELLFSACDLLQTDDSVRAYYQNAYSCLLVDEFQDINSMQYQWFNLLRGEGAITTVVGDDDQTIYTWRGARVENLRQYQSELTAEVIRLEQNYRSTGMILEAADSVIQHNSERLGKHLRTNKSTGDRLQVYSASDDSDEADFVAEIAKQWHEQSGKWKGVAVLYRSNAQSRLLERSMRAARIPYRLFGGTRFYSRTEIKDAMAWLALINRPDDNLAFLRAATSPRCGIGDKTLAQLNQMAQSSEEKQSLWDSAQIYVAEKSTRYGAIQAFLDKVQHLRSQAGQPLAQLVEQVVEHSGLLAMCEKWDDLEGRAGLSKADNLRELIAEAVSFDQKLASGAIESAEGLSPLAQFVSDSVLNAGDESGTEGVDYVSLMTIHTAKGLEFPWVCLVGMEEELFPHIRSIQSGAAEIEEERRLCYVGMTRAMERLYMTWSQYRTLGGSGNIRLRSRFLTHIPDRLTDRSGFEQQPQHSPLRGEFAASRNRQPDPVAAEHAGPILRAGQSVRHPTFGQGIVVSSRIQGKDTAIQIHFDSYGTKWLLRSHANLSLE
ncbi:MAG: ATP-dependent helicase [Gammaproteobacteria bacterium]